ncbi:peroxiredoxin Q/BCP [Nitrobacteraceae bacterium AZCC 2146]
MSKKSRKNSSKAPARKTARAVSKAPVKKAAKAVAKGVAKGSANKSSAKKSVAKAAKPASKVAANAPRKVSAKTLKATPVAKRAKAPAAAKPVVTKAATKPPAAPKPIKEKTTVVAAPAVAVEGAKAPTFHLPRDGGATVSLTDHAGQKLVIFFYPRANTPGCTKEAIDFTRLAGDFSAAGTAVLGVSADPLKAQESFRDKHDLTTPLLSDETHAMLKAYGAWGEKSMYGKVFEGVLRTTVLIDKDGKVTKIWRGVKVDGHADAVLEEARRI